MESDVMEKFITMVNEGGFKADGTTIRVECPWYSHVEIRVSTGMGLAPNLTSVSSDTRIFLTLEETDKLIARLLIARNVLVEKSHETE